MTTPNEAPKPQQPRPQTERSPIPIERLLITVMNPSGVELPHGNDGKSVRRVHTVIAGTEGDIKTEIEHRPWMRVFRVTKLKRVSRTDEKAKKEVVEFVPMGRPFHIPDSWAVSVPTED
jgi:hypothetical protein